MRAAGRLQEIGGEQRGQEPRHHQGEDHRHGDRQAELLEELAGDAGDEGHRREHHDDGHGRGHHREPDGIGPDHGGSIGTGAGLHPLLDVLDLDDGVVDQDADHQRQGQKGDDVQAEAHGADHREGRQQRQGHGQGGDQGGAPVAQEQEHHQGGQDHAFDQHVDGGFVALPGLVDGGDHLGEGHLLVLGGESLDRGLDPLLGRDLADQAGLVDREGHGGATVQPGEAARFRFAVADVGDLGQAHIALGGRDGQVAQLVDGLGLAKHPHRLFLRADVGAQEQTVRVLGQAKTVDQLRNLTIPTAKGYVRLSEVADVGDLGQAHIALGGRDGQVAQLVDGLGLAKHPHRLFLRADVGAAAGFVGVELEERVVDLGGGHAPRGHPRRVEEHVDLAVHPADAGDLRHALLPLQRPGDRVVHEPGQLGGRKVGAGDRIGQDRGGIDVQLLDLGRVDRRRQQHPRPLDRGTHVVGRLLQVGAQLELDGGGRGALHHRRGDVTDVGDAGDRILDRAGDLGLHFRRRRAGLGHRHGDRGEGDVRELLDRHGHVGDQAGEAERDEQDRDRDRVADRPAGDGESHRGAPEATRTWSPSSRKAEPPRATRAPTGGPSISST